jgi:hypothetical protein
MGDSLEVQIHYDLNWKKYSWNLGKKYGIDLVYVPMNEK